MSWHGSVRPGFAGLGGAWRFVVWRGPAWWTGVLRGTAPPGVVKLGMALRGLVSLAVVRPGPVRSDRPRQGTMWWGWGPARLAQAELGSLRRGLSWSALALRGLLGYGPVRSGMVWFFVVWTGEALRGGAWSGLIRSGQALLGEVCQSQVGSVEVRSGKVSLHVVWRCEARAGPGDVWSGPARLAVASLGVASYSGVRSGEVG